MLSFAPVTSYSPRLVSSVYALKQGHTHTQARSQDGPGWEGWTSLRMRNQNLLPFALELLAFPRLLTDTFNQQEETAHWQGQA